jgi:threonine/homoserine/homoserine lactone efflux protein
MSDPLLYALAVLTLLGTPGPTNTLLATSGALSGLRHSLPLLIGELGGYLVAIGTIRLVLGPVFAAYPPLGIALKVAVAVYLGWIAIRLWRRGAVITGPARPVTIGNVFVTTLLNPKALIFSLSIIPAAHPELAWFVAGFVAMVVTVGFGWIAIGTAIGATAGERHAGIVPRIASVALVGFAGLVLASAFG